MHKADKHEIDAISIFIADLMFFHSSEVVVGTEMNYCTNKVDKENKEKYAAVFVVVGMIPTIHCSESRPL